MLIVTPVEAQLMERETFKLQSMSSSSKTTVGTSASGLSHFLHQPTGISPVSS